MEESKVFRIISRTNSILFLLLLLGIVILVVIGIFQSNKWQNRRAVEVIDQENSAVLINYHSGRPIILLLQFNFT